MRRARIRETDVVLEIGAGLGRLTELLAESAEAVAAVEIDRGLFNLLDKRLGHKANIRLFHGDFLRSKHLIEPNLTSIVAGLADGKKIKVVANLPYQISSPAIINLLEWEIPLDAMYVMVQREVAERLAAGPGVRQYGPLSVFAQYWADVGVFAQVAPSDFWPQPDVSSSLVALTCRPPAVEAKDYSVFSNLVNLLFQNRRKMLRKALKIGFDSQFASEIMGKSGMDGRLRAGNLRVDEIVSLANEMAV